MQEEKQALGGTGARELGATRIPVEPDGSRVTGKKAGHGEISVQEAQLVPPIGEVPSRGSCKSGTVLRAKDRVAKKNGVQDRQAGDIFFQQISHSKSARMEEPASGAALL